MPADDEETAVQEREPLVAAAAPPKAVTFVEGAHQEHLRHKVKYAALIAHSKLRATSVSMLLCVVIFLSILTARLELMNLFSWPVYIDFIPLWILPCLLYLTATDFAATRISTEAALGKIIVVCAGFLLAVDILFFTVFICMKIEGTVQWPWTVVLAPFWATLVVAQFFLCFLIPGFLRVDKLSTFFMIFGMVWLMGFMFLLVGLKLDGDLPGLPWCLIILPSWLMILVQIVALEKNVIDTGCRAVFLLCMILLGLQLDKHTSLPWLLVFGPIIFIIFLNMVIVCQGSDDDWKEGPKGIDM